MDLNTVTSWVAPARAPISPRSATATRSWPAARGCSASRRWACDGSSTCTRSAGRRSRARPISATCTLAELAGVSPLARQCCEALRGSFKVWNVATVGGNLCCALPAGPVAAYVAALDGVCTLWSADGVREVPALEFITGPGETVLRPGELLRSIRVGAEPPRVALRQFSLTPIGRSAALLIGRADPFVLTITGATPRPVQVTSLDELDELEYFDDVHGSPEWRRQLVRVLARGDRRGADVRIDGVECDAAPRPGQCLRTYPARAGALRRQEGL